MASPAAPRCGLLLPRPSPQSPRRKIKIKKNNYCRMGLGPPKNSSRRR
jgi:hypothetical protein